MSPIVHLEKHKKYSDFCECSMVYWNLEKKIFYLKRYLEVKEKNSKEHIIWKCSSTLFKNKFIPCAQTFLDTLYIQVVETPFSFFFPCGWSRGLWTPKTLISRQWEVPSFRGYLLSTLHPPLVCVAGHMPWPPSLPLSLSSPGAWGCPAALLHALTLDRLPPWVCPEGKRLLIREDFSCIYSHEHGFLKRWLLWWECKLIQMVWRFL